MKLNSIVIIISMLAVNSYATTIDYRHEFRDTAKGDHRDRLLFANRFDNGIGISLEGRWAQHSNNTKSNALFTDSISNGQEASVSYLKKLGSGFSLESGLQVDSTSDSTKYKPYVRAGYAINDDLGITLRYRPYYKRISKNIGYDSNTHESGYNLTSVIAYKFLDKYAFEYEFDYEKANSANAKSGSQRDYSFTHDFKLAYSLSKEWKPYIGIGNVIESSSSSNRQTRYRVGLQYNF